MSNDLLVRLGMNSSQFTAAIQDAIKDMKKIEKNTADLRSSVVNLEAGFERLGRTARAAFAGWGIKELSSTFLEAGISMDRMRRGLEAAAGSAEGGKDAMKFLREESERLGTVLQGQIVGYQQLVAASRGTKMSTEDVKNIFSAVAEASTVMQLSSQKNELALYALQQMMSKGTVTMEELRRQLGDQIPGAFQIAARAMGVTTRELGKMIEEGKVISDEFLPKFAKQLKEEMGAGVANAAKSAYSEISRLKNIWFELRAGVMEGGTLAVFVSSVREVVVAMKQWYEANELLIKSKIPFYVETFADAVKTAVKLTYDWGKVALELIVFAKVTSWVLGATAAIGAFTTAVKVATSAQLTEGLAAYGSAISKGAVTANVISGVKTYGEALKAATLAQLGLNAATKTFLPIALGYGAFKASEFFHDWATGARQARKDTIELTEEVKRQKKLLEQRTKEKENSTEAILEAQELKYYAEQTEKYHAREEDLDAEYAEEEKKRAKAVVREKDRVQREWLKIKVEYSNEELSIELNKLNAEYEAYSQITDDRILLEKWYADEKEKLQDKALNKTIETLNKEAKVWEEVVKITGSQDYVDRAIEANNRLLAAEEEKNAKLLNDAQAALDIRLIKEQEYYNELDKLIHKGLDREEKAILKDKKKIYEEWLEIKKEYGKNAYEEEVARIHEEYNEYLAYADDLLALNEHLYEQLDEAKRKFLRKNKSNLQEEIRTWQEYIKKTGDSSYVHEIRNVISRFLDEEEKKWAIILRNDSAAHDMRLKAEIEYYKDLEGLIDSNILKEKEAAEEKASISKELSGKLKEQNVGHITGLPVGSKAGGVIYNGVVYATEEDAKKVHEDYWNGVAKKAKEASDIAAKAAKEQADIQEKAAKEVADAAEKAAKEQEKYSEAIRRTFETSKNKFQDFIQNRERATWGAGDWIKELEKLTAAFHEGSPYDPGYFESHISILDQLLDGIKELESVAKDELDVSRQSAAVLQSTFGSVSATLNMLSMGDLAPVQSPVSWGQQYNLLYGEAAKFTFGSLNNGVGDFGYENDNAEAEAFGAAVEEYLSFIPDYLEFMSGFGEDYASIVGSVVKDLEKIGGEAGLSWVKKQLDVGDLFSIDINSKVPVILSDMLNVDSEVLANQLAAMGVNITNVGTAANENSGYVGTFGTKVDSAGTEAQSAATQTYNLGTVLQGTEAPFQNVTTSMNSLVNTTKTQLAAVAGLWDTLTAGIYGASSNIATGINNTYTSAQANPVYQQQYVSVPWIRLGPPFADFSGNKWQTWQLIHPVTGEVVMEQPTYWNGTIFPEPTPHPIKLYAKGGLTDPFGINIAGEKGREWIVPTYEPERSDFLNNAPDNFWDNLSGGYDISSMSQASPIHNNFESESNSKIVIQIGDKVIAELLVSELKKGNRDLIQEIRRIM